MENKRAHNLNSAKNGFSLTELLVTVSVTAILSLMVSSLGLDVLNIVRKTDAAAELASLNSLIRLHLSRPARGTGRSICSVTFQGNHNISMGHTAANNSNADNLNRYAKATQDFTNQFDLRDDQGNLVLNVNGAIGGNEGVGLGGNIGNRYRLQSAIFRRMGNADFAINDRDGEIVNQFTGVLELSYQNDKGVVNRAPFHIPMSIRERSDGTLKSCSAMAEDTSAQILPPPLYSCVSGGSFLDTKGDPGSYKNPFTDGYSCPAGFEAYPSGSYNYMKPNGKYGAKMVQHVTKSCYKCPPGHSPPTILIEAAAQPESITVVPVGNDHEVCGCACTSGGCP